MSWSRRPVDREEVRAVAARYRCDNLTASILLRRSLAEPADALFFLEEDAGYLHNPFLMQGMEAAVERIRLAAKEGQPVFLFGDRDVDGVTSLHLLRLSLREAGVEARCGMPEGDDEYGLSEKWVRRVREAGSRLIVTVDCGISSRKEIALASELGIDCIVTDHHNPPAELPACVALLDPKIDGSGYPFRELSGCGVAWKLDWALCFSRTPEYGRELCLLTTRPANDALVVDVLRLRNLCIVDSLSETLLPGMVRYEGSRLARFLGSSEVLVYGLEEEAQNLARLFEDPVTARLREARQELWSATPALEGRSLLRILQESKAPRYSARPLREVDLFGELYRGYVLNRCRAALEPARSRLDLVALGTLSDLMALRDENRILVRTGMALLSASPRSGIRELMATQDLLGKRLSTRDVAWKISPVLNAAGRMGQPAAALELLSCDGMERAAAQAEALIELNRRRKALGDKVWEECYSDAAASLEKAGGKVLLVSGERIHWGITGILAARLAAAFHAPAVVVAEQPERCVGSVRSPKGYSLAGFLDRFEDLLAGYGGHDHAAGFSLPRERLSQLQERFYEIAGGVDLKSAEVEEIEIDAELPPAYLTPAVAEVVDRFEPYGEGNPPLTFLTRGLVVESIDILGRPTSGGEAPHARLLLAGEKHRWPAVFWNGASKIREGVTLHRRVDVVYRVERNYYMGMDNLRLNVVDIAT